MIGNIHKITKRNLLKGIPWRFGPNWPGQRCKAKTRRGTLCQRPAKLPVGQCCLSFTYISRKELLTYIAINNESNLINTRN